MSKIFGKTIIYAVIAALFFYGIILTYEILSYIF